MKIQEKRKKLCKVEIKWMKHKEVNSLFFMMCFILPTEEKTISFFFKKRSTQKTVPLRDDSQNILLQKT